MQKLPKNEKKYNEGRGAFLKGNKENEDYFVADFGRMAKRKAASVFFLPYKIRKIGFR